MNDLNELIEKARAEIQGMSEDEKNQLAGGYDNRGLDCISQRWYGPERLRDGALYKLGEAIIMIDNVLNEELEDYTE